MGFPVEVLGESKEKEKLLVILKRNVCLNCLGRQWGMVGHGMTNAERGKTLMEYAEKMTGAELKEPKDCELCNNFFKDGINKVANEITKKVRGIEFGTFVIGTIVSDELERKQENLWEETGIEDVETLKSEMNREMGKTIEKLMKKKFDLKSPDVTIIVDMNANTIRIQVKSLYIYGKYQKLARGIPQTKWICSKCNGKGCTFCKGEGKLYKTSIQEIIENPLLKATKGKNSAFHGCVAGNTKILLDECMLDASLLKSSWKDHELITCDTGGKKLKISSISDFIELDTKGSRLKTYELHTKETGRSVIATGDHPFFTSKGMFQLNKIKEGTKLVVYPFDPPCLEKSENITLVDSSDLITTIEKYVPTTNKQKVFEELYNKKLLPLSYTNPKISILTRILAFLFGDGTVRLSRHRDVGLEFYGNKEDLRDIESHIKNLGFKTSWKTFMPKKSIVKDFYKREKVIQGKKAQSVLLCYSKSLWLLLVALGAPVGNKIIKEVNIPEWIKKTKNLNLKAEFLSSLLGTEIDKPRLDKRKYNRKSFNTPRFSINKSETLVDSGLSFINDLKNMLEDFRIKTSKPRLIPYSFRKDGNKTFKICLDFSNSFDNLLNLFGKIGFRYAKEKDLMARYVYEYLLMKRHVVELRKSFYARALELKRNGLTLMQIYRKLDTHFVKYKDLALWTSPKNHKFSHIKIPNDFPEFLEWKRNATKNLNNGLVWETVESVKEVPVNLVYDLTTKKDTHTFFANGFLVSNSGREDIDARNLGWRPFVIEMIKPAKRKITLKEVQKKINKSKKVNVKGLKFVEKNVIRKLKTDRIDKTYLVDVEFKNKIDKKLLKDLKLVTKEPILQQTPLRVMHRRTNKTRKRHVKSFSYKVIGDKRMQFKVRGESGLYIKELITGDEGRTQPNVSELISNKVKKLSLDVIKIWTGKG